MLGEDLGREDDKERILAYNIGIAACDIFIGGKIYEMLESRDAEIEDVKFKEDLEKFYI